MTVSPRSMALITLSLGMLLLVVGAQLKPGRGGDEDIIGLTKVLRAKYDAANGTTVVATGCHACSEPLAYLVQGDASGLEGAGSLHLRTEGPDPYAKTQVEPFVVYGGMVDGATVSSAFAGPFVVYDVAPRLALVIVGLSIAGAGAIWILITNRLASWWSAVPFGLAGLAWGWHGATQGDGAIVVLVYGIMIAPVAGLLLFWRPARPHAAGLLLALLLADIAMFQLYAFYPSSPAI